MVTPVALPVMLIVLTPVAAPAATATEIDCVVAALSIVPPVTVTPDGAPVAARVTGPAKPPPRTIVAVSVVDAPGFTVAEDGEIDRLTVGVGAGETGSDEPLPPHATRSVNVTNRKAFRQTLVVAMLGIPSSKPENGGCSGIEAYSRGESRQRFQLIFRAASRASADPGRQRFRRVPTPVATRGAFRRCG